FVALGDLVLKRKWIDAAVAGPRRTGRGAGKSQAHVALRRGGRPRDRHGAGQRRDDAPPADGYHESDTPDPQTSIHGISWLGRVAQRALSIPSWSCESKKIVVSGHARKPLFLPPPRSGEGEQKKESFSRYPAPEQMLFFSPSPLRGEGTEEGLCSL